MLDARFFFFLYYDQKAFCFSLRGRKVFPVFAGWKIMVIFLESLHACVQKELKYQLLPPRQEKVIPCAQFTQSSALLSGVFTEWHSDGVLYSFFFQPRIASLHLI